MFFLRSCCFILLLVGVQNASLADEAVIVPTRDHALAFELKTLDGETIQVTPADSGVTVVCFLGTECPLVQLYGVRLSQMADELRDRGVRFVGVNSNFHDTSVDIRQYLQRQSLSFPLVRDEGNEVADRFGATRTPEVFVLDHRLSVSYQGRIDDQYEPGVTRTAATRDDLLIAIEETLAGKAVSVAKTDAVGCLIGKVRHPKTAPAEGAASSSLTYCKDVSRIMQTHCLECHRTGDIGPFSLEAYEDVVGWADTSLEVIDNGRMPPWHADPKYGSFANAREMPDADKQVLRDWVAAGTPKGDVVDLPEPVAYTQGWQMGGEPDLVVTMRNRPYVVPAEGMIDYQYFVVDPKITEDAWVTAAQIIPGNRAVVHHAIVFIRPPDGSEFRGIGWLTAYVPGQRLVKMPPGHARKIPAGSRLVFQMHYTANGSVHEDTTKVGIVFGKREHVTHEVVTLIGIDQEFEIPPYAANHEVNGRVRSLPKDGHLLGVAPHMHVRGKTFQLFADRDGHTETLLHVPNYDFNWQHSYVFTESLNLGTIDSLRFKVTFDNSAANPFNPDPSQWVNWGDQTWEEMAVAFLEVAEPLEPAPTTDTSVVAGISVSSESIAAREAQIQKFVDDYFSRLDVNGDGVVSRGELPIAVRGTFRRFDQDGDDLATLDEVRAVAENKIP